MTKIPWTNETINPWVGCTKCADGCRECYAETMAWRLKCMGKPAYQRVLNSKNKWNGNIVRQAGQLEKVLSWRKPRMIFWGSMTDIFHPKVPFEWIDPMMAVIALTPQHTHQILTKRPERMAEYFEGVAALEVESERDMVIWDAWRAVYGEKLNDRIWPLPNLWLGTSISTQADTDKNIPILMQIPAAVRFISLEPMLERIDFYGEDGSFLHDFWQSELFDTNNGVATHLHQIIIGCESGPKRRPCRLEWVKDVIRQCDEAGVSVFVKQLDINGKVSHNPKEWARRQEFPK